MNRILLVVPLIAAGLALAGCQPTAPAETSDSPEPTPTETVVTPEEPPAPVFSLPADCDHIASTATLNTVFGGVDQRDPADLTRPAPASATKLLTCSWFAGDVTGGDVIYYQTTAAAAQSYLSVVEANGYSCLAAFEGTRCDKQTTNSEFGTTSIETVFTRDDTWIYIGTSNVDPAPLLPDLVATAWSA
ncbi:MAG: hypothetical protein R2717_07700 [Schumannella sp.]|nr:hypothetical protein [Microbacteriaceae bacterium]